jgi:peptide deformylase
MAILEIKKYGDPVLRKKSLTVENIDDKIKSFARNVLETMYSVSGVGLAAPQVGVLIRLCVIDVTADKNSPVVLINPEIKNVGDKIESEEGCLSFPKTYEKIKRFNKVDVEFTDLEGKIKRLKVDGFFAKAVQHEIDHLDAKLFIDYLPDWRRKILEKEIKRKKKVGEW